MATMQSLRQKAKRLGIRATLIRSAENSAELEQIISDHSGSNSKRRVVKKKAATVRRGPGRPKGSKNKPKATTTRKRTTRKATTTRTTRKATTRKPARASSNGNGGRHLLGRVNFSRTKGWNPREGSTPDVIVTALAKFKGDRDKAYNSLVKRIKSLVPPTTRNGRRRNMSERQEYLRYLINRNAWSFALATGQHDKSEDRVEYGTGGTGEGVFKRKRGKATGGTRKPKRGPGRPKGSRNKATAQKATPRRTGAKRGPGRPKGSKNKPKPRR